MAFREFRVGRGFDRGGNLLDSEKSEENFPFFSCLDSECFFYRGSWKKINLRRKEEGERSSEYRLNIGRTTSTKTNPPKTKSAALVIISQQCVNRFNLDKIFFDCAKKRKKKIRNRKKCCLCQSIFP